jgi:hypothetical protein
MLEHSKSLEKEAVEVISGLRSAFAGVLGALPKPCRKAADVSKVLGLSRKLGWQIWKVATSSDPFSAAQHLPSPAGVASFLAAAAPMGVAQPILAMAEAAAKRVDNLVSIHAGDRSSLELMIDSFAGERHETQEEVHRRNAFKANSYIFGSQLRTRLVLHVLKPGSESGRIDVAIVNGLYGLRRLRADARRLLFSTGVRDALRADGGGLKRESLASTAMDMNASMARMDLMPEFCSKPLPRIEASPPRDGYVDFELAQWPIGETGSVTMVSGEVFWNFASRYRRPGDIHANLVAHINRPTELLVHDVLVHKDLWQGIRPRALVYGELDRVTRVQSARRDDDRLHVKVTVDELGQGIAVAASPDVPQYAELLQAAFDRLAWSDQDFAVYRLRLSYPILPTAVVLQFDLPES